MTAVDFFYTSLGAGFLVLVVCAVVLAWQIKKILSDVQSVTEDVAGAAEDLTALKDGVKVAVINLVQSLLDKAKPKGGEKKRE